MPDDFDRPDPIGQTVGNYKILRKLSTGGMGTVYYAEHALIGRTAAIKILHPELSGSKEIVGRFFNEAKATTSIKHPGIVEVFDYGYMPNGDGYIVMEFLEGMSLARRLKKGGRYGEGEAAMLIRGVCSALSAAHQKGIIHRDLKPDNIFLVDDAEAAIGERPKVLDFGIAKLTDIGLAGEGTKTGAVMGTPTYMSPEQCKGTGNVDVRADLYSLGCILYELVCGRPPFKNLGAGELIGAHQHLQPDPPSTYAPNITPEMSDLIVCLLQKDPAKRLQTAPELAQRLAKIAARHGYQISMTHITPVPGIAKLAEASSSTLSPDVELKTTSEDPTTLTRGAAESVATSGQPKRSGWWKVAPVVALLAAAGVAIATFTAMKKDDAPASAPAQVQPAASPTPPPAPASTPEEVKPLAPPVEEAKPAAPPVEEAKPAETKPVETKPVETKPVEAKPVEAKPVEAKPVETKPVETKIVKKPKPPKKPAKTVVKPPVTKPPTPPPVTKPPPKPKGPLETDI